MSQEWDDERRYGVGHEQLSDEEDAYDHGDEDVPAVAYTSSGPLPPVSTAWNDAPARSASQRGYGFAAADNTLGQGPKVKEDSIHHAGGAHDNERGDKHAAASEKPARRSDTSATTKSATPSTKPQPQLGAVPANTKKDAMGSATPPTPARKAKPRSDPRVRGLSSTVEHAAAAAPAVETAEAKILGVLRANEGDVSSRLLAVFAQLDQDARERLKRALKSYRPGMGGELGEIGARFARLDPPVQRELLDALAMPPSAASPAPNVDVVHDPALAPDGPLSFTEEPNSIAVETSCRQDPTTKDFGELAKGVPVTTSGAKATDDTAKAPSPAAVAHYLNVRSRDVWGSLREYLYAAVWPSVPARLEWNEMLFTSILINELESRGGELTETRLRELLYPHDVLAAIAPHVLDGKEQHLPGAVKLILGQLFRAALGPSVARMTGRYVDVADAMYAANPASAPTVRRDQLFGSSPVDRYVANALASGVARVAPDADILSGKRKPPRVALRPIQLTFMGATDPALWFVVRAEPGDATPEEVAASLFSYAQQNGEPTSHYAYGIASVGALHALPASWAIQFPEARDHAPKAIQDGALPEPTGDSIGARLAIIASTDSSDAIALAQTTHDPKAATLSAAQVAETFGQCAIQLEHLRRGLVGWDLADPIVAEIGYVVGKQSHVASLPPDQLGTWGAIALGQRERLYRIAAGLHAVNDAAASMGIADKRSKSASALRDIVGRYATAGATSHLATTSEQILAEAQRMQAGLSLRALQANIVELESAMESGRRVTGSDKQMREQAHAYLETKEEARILESKLLNGGEVSAEDMERVQIQAQELALQSRLHSTQIQVNQLVDAWRSAGQGLLPTIVSTRKFNDIGPASVYIHTAIGEIYNDLNAEAKKVEPVNDQTGGTIESAQLDARRAALGRAQQRFAQLQQDNDLAHFFNDAYDAVKSQQLRTAIAHAAVAIGIGIASAGVAGWVAEGLVAAQGVGAIAELSMGARIAVAATEVMGNAIGQTMTTAGQEHGSSFMGALVDNAAFVLAPKMLAPAEHNINAARAFEHMLTKQLARIEAQEARAAAAMQVLAKTGRVLSWTTHQAGTITAHTVMGMAMGAIVAKGHQLASGKAGPHGAGGAELTQDLMIQGASVALGKLVHGSIGERLPGYRQLAKRKDVANTQQLLSDALALHQLAAEISAHPDAKLALELLHKRSSLLELELHVLDGLSAREAAHPTQGAPSAREIAAMRSDVKAQLGEVVTQAMLDVQWRLVGLHELAPGVWSGTREQLAAAIEEAKTSGHRVEGIDDDASVSRRVRIDGKDVELHATERGPVAGKHDDRTAQVGRDFEGARSKVDPDSEHLPRDVIELIAKHLPGIEFDPSNPARGIEAYLRARVPGADHLKVVPLGGGKSGASVYLVKNGDHVVGVFKIFNNTTEMAREIAALQRIRDLRLEALEPVEIGHAATVAKEGTNTGAALMEPARGEFVKNTLDAAGAATGAARAEVIAKLTRDSRSVAKGLAELHVKSASGAMVSGEYKAQEIQYLKNRWERIVSTKQVGRADADAIRARLGELFDQFQDAMIDASYAHGDAHAGNFSVRDGGKVSVIDTETLFRSIGADGRGASSGASDVGRFVESLRTFGSEAGLTPAEISDAQQSFLNSYMTHFNALSGRSPAGGFEIGTRFYQANLDTIALRAAADRARTLRPSTDDARTAAARVAELVDALKATLGLPSRFAVRSTSEETQ